MALKSHSPSATTGMDIDTADMAIPNTCHGCKMGKSAHHPFSGTGCKMKQILEVIHSDLVGPMEVRSIQGSQYYATFIDNHSHYAVVHSLCNKDQLVATFKQYLA